MRSAGFRLTVEMKSDWHVGTGAGIPGGVDRLALRGPDGLPFIPAKTLTGRLRDSAESVACALDRLRHPAAGGTWAGILDRLFGSDLGARGAGAAAEPMPAKIAVDPARIRGRVREVLAGPAPRAEWIREALFSIQPGVRIDRRSQRAEDDKLFFFEKSRGGMPLEADVTVLSDLDDAECALLAAGVAGLRRLGGKRSRGGGECRVELSGLPAPPGGGSWLDWLEKNFGSADLCSRPGNTESVRPQAIAGSPPGPFTGSWFEVALSLRAEQPVLVHAATKGNTTESLDFVPGTYLLPIIFRRLEEAGVPPERLRQAVEGGGLVVSPLSPRAGEKRGVPVPNVWFHPKEDPGLAREGGNATNALVEKLPDGQQKGYRDGWIGVDAGGAVTGYEPGGATAWAMHNTVDDALQRPSETVGGVYGYRAIPAGTRLEGLVLIRSDVLVPSKLVWEAALGEGLRVGRSKKDDYGNVQLLEVSESELRSGEVMLHENDGKSLLVVYLQSDLLVPGPELSYRASPDDLRIALSAALFGSTRSGGGAALKWASAEALGGALSSAGRVRRTDSWQTSWGLPRPSLTALRAGSVFTFEVTRPEEWDGKAAASLEVSGLGDRRAEGYGRILFNPPWLLAPMRRAVTSTPPPAPSAGEASTPARWEECDRALLRDLEPTAWKRRIVHATRRYALLEEGWLGLTRAEWKSPTGAWTPSPSQWGALRAAALACRDRAEDPLAPLSAWSAGIRGTPSRLNAWGELRLRAVENLWMAKGAEKGKLWSWLFPEGARTVSGASIPMPLDPTAWEGCGPEETLAATLRPFAVRILIGALCEAVLDEQGRAGDRG